MLGVIMALHGIRHASIFLLRHLSIPRCRSRSGLLWSPGAALPRPGAGAFAWLESAAAAAAFRLFGPPRQQ